MNSVPALSYFPGGQQLPNLNRNRKPCPPLPTDNVDLRQLKYYHIAKNADIANSNLTEEKKVKEMITQSSQEYNPSNYLKKSTMTGPVPLTYVCYRCKQPGHHWINNCPTKKSKVKRSTGIPLTSLVAVDGPGHKGALLTKTGCYAVPKLDLQAYKKVKKEKPPFAPQDEYIAEPKTQIPKALLCMICKDLVQDAVTTPCCTNFFCDDCVRDALLESENLECPECHKTGVSPNELEPELSLRRAAFMFNNTSRYTLDIISPPVHIENMERLRLSHDSTVGIQPQQPIPPKSGLNENSLSQDILPAPLANESSFDIEQPTLPIQAIAHSSAPKSISTIVTVNRQKSEHFYFTPVHQQFANERENRPDFYNRNGDYYERHQAVRSSQWPGYYSRYNRSPHARYHYSDNCNNENNQYHGYDVEYDNCSRSGEPVCRQADSYRIVGHPFAIPPLVSVANLPVAQHTLPASQVFTPQSQHGPPGALNTSQNTVNTSHITAEPPPPGVEPLVPPTLLIDPSAPFNKPPLNQVDDRNIDMIDAFQRDRSKIQSRKRICSPQRKKHHHHHHHHHKSKVSQKKIPVNADHHRRYCPKRNLSSKLRTSHNSRDRRERDIGLNKKKEEDKENRECRKRKRNSLATSNKKRHL